MFEFKTATALAIATSFLAGGAQAAVVDISGSLPSDFNTSVGIGNSARLVGDTTTYWQGGTYEQDVDLNGYVFTIDTGGGNNQTYSGAITGSTKLVFVGRGNIDDVDFNDGMLAGSVANVMSGLDMDRGTLNLNKSAGVDALAGTITVINTVPNWESEISLRNSNQINDAATIDASPSAGLFVFEMNDNSESFASLILKAGDYVETDGDKTEADGSSAVLTLGSLSVGGVSYGAGTYTSGNSSFVTGAGSVVVVPEPASIALLGLGGLSVMSRRRR